MSMPRPGPHDLLLSSLEVAGVLLAQESIVELREGTFIAELVLSNGARVDARASDAIALALRAKVPVWCAEPVLEAAGVVLDVDEVVHAHVRMVGELGEAAAAARVARLREFLDSVDPEGF